MKEKCPCCGYEFHENKDLAKVHIFTTPACFKFMINELFKREGIKPIDDTPPKASLVESSGYPRNLKGDTPGFIPVAGKGKLPSHIKVGTLEGKGEKEREGK